MEKKHFKFSNGPGIRYFAYTAVLGLPLRPGAANLVGQPEKAKPSWPSEEGSLA